ncbi:MAG: hypothetical protein Q8M15_09545 [Bacteroidota bacterium]|nr:hypothetical protein [Bacteroidota bacterium]
MKLLIKYIWTLVLIPALVFLKGDLSFDTYMYINSMNPPAEIAKTVGKVVASEKMMSVVVKINPISKNKGFSADGMPVQMFDEYYNLIQQSQVIRGKVHFEIPFTTSQNDSYIVVSTKTADEIKLDNIFVENTLAIHESQLADFEIQ